MKISRYLALCSLLCFGVGAYAQQDTSAHPHGSIKPYKPHTISATVSAGFIDWHRQDFDIPVGFEKGKVSGYALFYGKLEYGLGERISLAAAFGYDAFTYNYDQLYPGYNGPVKRYFADHYRVVSGGLIAYYHLTNVIRVKNLDPFFGVGFTFNNMRHSALPQSDSSTIISMRHNATPYLKIGVRYYITDRFSLFADAGYDQQSIFSVGLSGRFPHRRLSK